MRPSLDRCLFLAILLTLLLSGVVSAQDNGSDENSGDDSPTILTIWLPEPLASPENGTATALIEQYRSDFIDSMANIDVVFRLKSVGDTGGLIATLKSASGVAPGALPDITLLRREQLVELATELEAPIIQSLEGRIPTAMLVDMEAGIELGQINNELFGLPYMLDVQQVVYRPTPNTDYDSWRFDDVLERGEPFTFPAVSPTGLNDVLFIQYLSAGGVLLRSGEITLNSSALKATLDFYEQAVDAELLTPDVLQFDSSDAYIEQFRDGELNSGVFTSTQYLTLLEADSSIAAAPIPIRSSNAMTVLNGWVWVITTSDSTQQELALQFLNWMMDVERQGNYARTIHMLPSLRPALPDGLPEDADMGLMIDLLDNARLPLSQRSSGTLARAIQDALVQVINEERTAEEATEDVIASQES